MDVLVHRLCKKNIYYQMIDQTPQVLSLLWQAQWTSLPCLQTHHSWFKILNISPQEWQMVFAGSSNLAAGTPLVLQVDLRPCNGGAGATLALGFGLRTATWKGMSHNNKRLFCTGLNINL